MMETFKDMADPEAIKASILWTMTIYAAMWLAPEPVFSKGLATVVTASFICYVGMDTFWTLIQGWRRLVETADLATSFLEIREAGFAPKSPTFLPWPHSPVSNFSSLLAPKSPTSPLWPHSPVSSRSTSMALSSPTSPLWPHSLVSGRSIFLSYTQVTDLSPLAALTGLQSLDLDGTRVEDFSPLKGLPALREQFAPHFHPTDV
jgi:hypothetical protein